MKQVWICSVGGFLLSKEQQCTRRETSPSATVCTTKPPKNVRIAPLRVCGGMSRIQGSNTPLLRPARVHEVVNVRKFIPGSLSIYNSPFPMNFAPPRVFLSATIQHVKQSKYRYGMYYKLRCPFKQFRSSPFKYETQKFPCLWFKFCCLSLSSARILYIHCWFAFHPCQFLSYLTTRICILNVVLEWI